MDLAFGGWLLGQHTRHDWIGLLAGFAKKDPRFPRAGDPETIRRHLAASGADPDLFEMLDDAEAAWLGKH